MSELCPTHCINVGCKDASFLEKHETLLLTIVTVGTSGLGLILAYFLKSRCHKIQILWGCLSCDRTVLELPIEETNVVTESVV